MSGSEEGQSHELVIIRRRSHGDEGGHHGGAWKIAYADFMTAMMAFFLVMWLINSTDKKTLTQVATYFKDYDNHLLFAGTNEITVNFTTPSQENCTVQQGFNQVFVDAVRATGGNNASRMLVVQGYATDIENTISVCGGKIPTDKTTG